MLRNGSVAVPEVAREGAHGLPVFAEVVRNLVVADVVEMRRKTAAHQACYQS